MGSDVNTCAHCRRTILLVDSYLVWIHVRTGLHYCSQSSDQKAEPA